MSDVIQLKYSFPSLSKPSLCHAIQQSEIQTIDRLGFISDAFALSRAGLLSTSDYLRVLQNGFIGVLLTETNGGREMGREKEREERERLGEMCSEGEGLPSDEFDRRGMSPCGV